MDHLSPAPKEGAKAGVVEEMVAARHDTRQSLLPQKGLTTVGGNDDSLLVALRLVVVEVRPVESVDERKQLRPVVGRERDIGDALRARTVSAFGSVLHAGVICEPLRWPTVDVSIPPNRI
jgi:hypothetical protein